MDHQNHHCKALHQVCQHKSCPFQFAFSIWAHQWTTRITIARPCTRFASTNHANFNLPSASGHTNGPPESPLQGPAPGLPAQIMPSVMYPWKISLHSSKDKMSMLTS